MFTLEQFKDNQERLKQFCGGLFANCFLMGEELEKLSMEETTEMIAEDKGLFIIKNEKLFERLYFFTSKNETTNILIDFLKKRKNRKPIVFDLTGRHKSVSKMAEQFEISGMQSYAKYNRYFLKNRKTPRGFYQNLCKNDNVRFGYGTENDSKEILKIFKDNFDLYTSHVPFTIEEVRRHLDKKEICCAYYHGHVAAAFCFERLDEVNVHLNVVASDKEYDSLGLAMLLYEYVLDIFEENTNFICWIEEKNKASRSMHDAFGFEQDLKMLFYFYVYEAKTTMDI